MPRLARLERVLGCRLENVAEADLQHLVDESVSEAEDLDFKNGIYWRGPKRLELAKDVAALANHVGGLLIIGIEEDGNARAIARKPLDIDDGTERSVQEIIANYVHPRPELRTRQVDGTGGRYLLIAVPRSPLAPHALQEPGKSVLSYPVRTATLTRWLTETEVADRYRNRFSDAATAVDRAVGRSSEVVTRLDLSSSPWLTLTVVPDIPAPVTIDSANGRRVEAWLWDLPGAGIDGRPIVNSYCRLGYGPQRFIFAQRSDANSSSEGIHVEVFGDGAAVVAISIGDSPDPSGPYAIAEEVLAFEMVAAVGLAGQLCVDLAGATGTAMAVAEIVEPRRGATGPPTRSMILKGAEPMIDSSTGYRALGSYRQLAGTRGLFTVESSRHVIDLVAVRDSATERIAAAHLLLRDLVQAFGLAEPRHLTSTGGLRGSYFMPWPEKWAEANGVECSKSLVR